MVIVMLSLDGIVKYYGIKRERLIKRAEKLGLCTREEIEQCHILFTEKEICELTKRRAWIKKPKAI